MCIENWNIPSSFVLFKAIKICMAVNITQELYGSVKYTFWILFPEKIDLGKAYRHIFCNQIGRVMWKALPGLFMSPGRPILNTGLVALFLAILCVWCSLRIATQHGEPGKVREFENFKTWSDFYSNFKIKLLRILSYSRHIKWFFFLFLSLKVKF